MRSPSPMQSLPPTRPPNRSHARRVALVVVLIAAMVAGCATPPPPPPPPDEDDIVLLIANYSNNRIEVMGAESDAAELAARPALSFDDTGAASTVHAVWGPDDRIYVSDFALSEIRVYEAEAALGSSTPAPVAILTSSDLQEPYAMAFDASGNLWVSDRRGSRDSDLIPNRLARFSDWSAATGETAIFADVILTLDTTTPAFGSAWISNLYIDAQGDLWFADILDWAVSRISDPASIVVDTFDVVPDLRLQSVDGGNADLSDIRNPIGIAVDSEGNVFVGNLGRDKVARFDDAASLAGDYAGSARQADATIAVGLFNTALVALAPDGALWVASSGPTNFAQMVRVTGQAAGTGEVALTPTKQFNWSSNTNAYHEAGGMLFHVR